MQRVASRHFQKHPSLADLCASANHFGPFGFLPADIWILLAQKYLPHSTICRLTCINSSLNHLFSSARAHRAKKRICKTTPSLIGQFKYEDNQFALQPQKGAAFLPDGRPIMWVRKIDETTGIETTKSTFFLGILTFSFSSSLSSSCDGISWTRISPLSYSGVEGLQVSSSRRLVYFLQILEDKKRICLETLDLHGNVRAPSPFVLSLVQLSHLMYNFFSISVSFFVRTRCSLSSIARPLRHPNSVHPRRVTRVSSLHHHPTFS
jgi:hypothetical protein